MRLNERKKVKKNNPQDIRASITKPSLVEARLSATFQKVAVVFDTHLGRMFEHSADNSEQMLVFVPAIIPIEWWSMLKKHRKFMQHQKQFFLLHFETLKTSCIFISLSLTSSCSRYSKRWTVSFFAVFSLLLSPLMLFINKTNAPVSNALHFINTKINSTIFLRFWCFVRSLYLLCFFYFVHSLLATCYPFTHRFFCTVLIPFFSSHHTNGLVLLLRHKYVLGCTVCMCLWEII